MPLYEYECTECGHRTELLQRYGDPPLEKCPECGGAVRKLFSAPCRAVQGHRLVRDRLWPQGQEAGLRQELRQRRQGEQEALRRRPLRQQEDRCPERRGGSERQEHREQGVVRQPSRGRTDRREASHAAAGSGQCRSPRGARRARRPVPDRAHRGLDAGAARLEDDPPMPTAATAAIWAAARSRRWSRPTLAPSWPRWRRRPRSSVTI